MDELDTRITNAQKDKLSAGNTYYYLQAFGQLYNLMTDGGIEEEWDSYLQKMEDYGLSEYLEIKQKYFDAYIESLSEEN